MCVVVCLSDRIISWISDEGVSSRCSIISKHLKEKELTHSPPKKKKKPTTWHLSCLHKLSGYISVSKVSNVPILFYLPSTKTVWSLSRLGDWYGTCHTPLPPNQLQRTDTVPMAENVTTELQGMPGSGWAKEFCQRLSQSPSLWLSGIAVIARWPSLINFFLHPDLQVTSSLVLVTSSGVYILLSTTRSQYL